MVAKPVASSFLGGFFGKGVTRAGSVMKAGTGYNNMDHMEKKL